MFLFDLFARLDLGNFDRGLAGFTQDHDNFTLWVLVNTLRELGDLHHRRQAIAYVVGHVAQYDRTTHPRIVGFEPSAASLAVNDASHPGAAPRNHCEDLALGTTRIFARRLNGH